MIGSVSGRIDGVGDGRIEEVMRGDLVNGRRAWWWVKGRVEVEFEGWRG